MKTMITKLGAASWKFQSNRVEAYLTQTGGHLGPIAFKLGGRKVHPLSVAPWAGEKLDPKTLPLLKVLRGDFFCCPFGANATPFRGESYPVHGQCANGNWNLGSIERSDGQTTLTSTFKSSGSPGTIEKVVRLVDGQTVVYQRHTLQGWHGPMPMGHHPMVLFPDEPGSGLLSFSRFERGQVYPGAFERPETRGYQCLKPGATFRSLDQVPMLNGGLADLSRYPARRGYEDLVMLIADPNLKVAWSAVVFPKQRYVWFALRDPQVLRNTVLWISNGGRHYGPWNGRHVNVMGIEDTTSYFADGLAASATKNELNQSGFKTAVSLNRRRPTTVTHIMACVQIPAGFDHVEEILSGTGGVELRSRSGKRAECELDQEWLFTSSMPKPRGKRK